MNTDVIALAADSTITINDKKTYNGVNKIFMLSNDPPMGIMVFGLGKFENISIETLIKEYSKKTDFKKLKNIINIKNDFFKVSNRSNSSNKHKHLSRFTFEKF
ncbi:hypothetical protein [Methanobrevibacter smithii]|uniref:hypothetical protein n=1 Tax=Methanobrevibacter smithii TaxID=2173 RepID=UPI000AAD631D|nr:hypothetical protein [Methanobrevibacter smithii]